MKEFKEKVRLPCDDKKIRSSHEDHLLEALTFFESETGDTTVTARWLYMEKLAVIKCYLMSALPNKNNTSQEYTRTRIKELRRYV